MSDKKMKFTAIDVLIVLIVLIALVVGAKLIVPSINGGDETQTATFMVMLQSKDGDFADAISVGDNVTVSLTEKDGGVVKNVETKPAEGMVYNSIDGVYSNEEIDGKFDVYVTVEAEASVNDLAIMVGGTAVKVGAEIPVRGKGYASSGYIIEIND